MYIQNIKSALVALVAFNALAASAVPAQDHHLEERDPYAYVPTKTVTKYATKYSTKYATKYATTKYATKYSTKYSTKYGYATTKTVTKTNSKCTKTTTKTTTKTSIKTSTKTSTKFSTKTSTKLVPTTITKTSVSTHTGLPLTLESNVVTIAEPKITLGGVIVSLPGSIITVPGTVVRGLGGNVVDIGATSFIVGGQTIKAGPTITLPEAIVTVAGDSILIPGGCVPDATYTATVTAGTVTVTPAASTVTETVTETVTQPGEGASTVTVNPDASTVTETVTQPGEGASTVTVTPDVVTVTADVVTVTADVVTVTADVVTVTADVVTVTPDASTATTTTTEVSTSVTTVVQEPSFIPGPRSVGCYADSGADAATRMNGGTPDVNGIMTIAYCQQYCWELNPQSGQTAAGLINGNECTCGDQWINNPHEWKEDAKAFCDIDCPGDPQQKCGGNGYVQQYVFARTPTSFGCYGFTAGLPILTGRSMTRSYMTPTICQAWCYFDGYAFSGLTGGDTCHCGNAFVNPATTSEPATSPNCGTTCSGSTTGNPQLCGGINFMDIYVWTG